MGCCAMGSDGLLSGRGDAVAEPGGAADCLPGRRARAVAPEARLRMGRDRDGSMARLKIPRRGDVYWVALDPAIGSEIRKTRPAVVVPNDPLNRFGTRVVVVPLTRNVQACFPGEAMVHVRRKPARAVGDQIRSIDKRRLRGRIDTLGLEQMDAIDRALRITLAIT